MLVLLLLVFVAVVAVVAVAVAVLLLLLLLPATHIIFAFLWTSIIGQIGGVSHSFEIV